MSDTQAESLIVKKLRVYEKEDALVVRFKVMRTINDLVEAHNRLVRLQFASGEEAICPDMPIIEDERIDCPTYVSQEVLDRLRLAMWLSLLVAWGYVCRCVGPIQNPATKVPVCKFCRRVIVEED